MPRSSRINLNVIDLLVLFTNNRFYCNQREIWSRRNLKLPLELPELVEELPDGNSSGTFLELVEEPPELVDPRMTRQNDVTTSKLLEVLTSQPQNY
jgi:hypothetical protein